MDGFSRGRPGVTGKADAMRGWIEPIIGRLMDHVLTFPEDAGGSPPVPPPLPGRRYLLYAHVPFCERLCPYCSFHRVQFRSDKAARYFRALRDEIRHYRESGYTFSEVYVGGGTPTVCVEELAATLALIRGNWPVREISVETNPNHLTQPVIDTLLAAGVRRLSVGVQSFDDGLLKAMDRYAAYGSGAAIAARLQDLRGAFGTLNADMIFNLPGQSRASLERDLDILREIDIDQVSFYPLMVADSSRRRMARTMGQVDYRNEETGYRLIRQRLGPTHPPSTVWTFSRGDRMIDEYIVGRDEYVGVGSGAFSYLRGSLYATSFSLNQYERLIDRQGFGVTRQRTYSRRWQLRYHLLMALFGLRLHRDRDLRQFGAGCFRALWKELTALRLLGAIRRTPDGYALTDRGMYLWLVMMRRFFTTVNNFRDQMRAHIREERIPEAGCPLAMRQETARPRLR
ncbi:MAG: coproporphyrinogen III oxidase family protein [Gammaproteobacteria bacterium]|nr:coproporphyrinogen III oxidase family protein [Gammaproteobacteria bacterium]